MITEELDLALELAKTRGTKPDKFFVNPDAWDELDATGGFDAREIATTPDTVAYRGVEIRKENVSRRWVLDCEDGSWIGEDHITRLDEQAAPALAPWEVDLTQPMMIDGNPELVVITPKRLADGTIEAYVYNYTSGNKTQITFRSNGWITSTTYSQDKVVNLATYEKSERARQQQGIAEMETNPLWGAF